ncbi:MAG: FliM/FliN family flagellar motor switch protein [Pirellulaceae bacterium]
MTKTDYPVYDFLTASRVERPLASALKNWMSKFCKSFADHWRAFATSQLQSSPMLINAMSFEEAKAKISRNSIGVPISINNDSVQGMIVTERADIIILMMDILVQALNERPVDRELTSIEMSMCRLFLEHSVSGFAEAWPDKDSMPIKMDELDSQPNRSRLFQPNKEVIVTGFEFRTANAQQTGPAKFLWILAKDELKSLLGVKAKNVVAPDNLRIDPANIDQLMVELTVHLGSTELPMNRLFELAPGDIVRFDQPIHQPLTLLVNNSPKMRAWPGCVGDKQSLMIESNL